MDDELKQRLMPAIVVFNFTVVAWLLVKAIYPIVMLNKIVAFNQLLFHILMHETRHWAQIALSLRRGGLEPPGNHDLFYSKALR